MEKGTGAASVRRINLKMERVGVLDSKQMLNKVEKINNSC